MTVVIITLAAWTLNVAPGLASSAVISGHFGNEIFATEFQTECVSLQLHTDCLLVVWFMHLLLQSIDFHSIVTVAPPISLLSQISLFSKVLLFLLITCRNEYYIGIL